MTATNPAYDKRTTALLVIDPYNDFISDVRRGNGPACEFFHKAAFS